MVVFNVLAVVKAAMRTAHGEQVQVNLSSHAMATHMRAMAKSFEETVEPQDWAVFQQANTVQMAQWLLARAALVSLKHYAKAPTRKTAPQPPTKRVHDPRKTHVSLAKLLAGAP